MRPTDSYDVHFREDKDDLSSWSEGGEVIVERGGIMNQWTSSVEEDEEDLGEFAYAPQLPPNFKIALEVSWWAENSLLI